MSRDRLTSSTAIRIVAVALVVVAVVLRITPHPWNLAPIGGIAVFSGAMFGARWGTAIALAAIMVSDLFVGLHDLIWVTWGTFAVIAFVSARWMRPNSGVVAVLAAGFGSATGFFITSNAAVWLQGALYPRTIDGLIDCFVAAIPFYRNSLIGDLFYCGLLFGAYRLAVFALAQRYREQGVVPRP